MATARALFEAMLSPAGDPERVLKQYEALSLVFSDPVNGYLRANRRRGSTSVDRWGTTILFPEDAPGAMPHITPENKVCPDITRWRDFVHAPDLIKNCAEGWEDCIAACEKVDRSEKLLTAFMGTGIFEQCHFLMGFEDTLTNLYEHPRQMHELIDYITDYRLTQAKLLIDHLHPDALLSHDDWGAKDSLFMKSDMWREFFKEPYRKFYGYIRSRGIIAIHHADSYLSPIVEDMAEIGIQVWQGVLPENDIPALQERLQGKLVLMGGIGAAIDRADATEEEIRDYVRRTLEENCPGGHYIPSITYGVPGAVFPQVDPAIDREIDAYNSVLHLPRFTPVRRAVRAAAAPMAAGTAATDAAEQAPVLQRLSEALRRGQKKKVLALCQEALDAGTAPEVILTDGLVDGMTRLGADFSANRVFVPEMLVAARCMNAAMDVLKPLFPKSADLAGRVCLGTVRGDMHDIGKNLVKIMMEGSGLEVIDLGVDVSAETFLETAQQRRCGLIACSALLTTTMPEMRRVVELVHASPLNNRVKIMVGGAPITQRFCDEIGADAYTDDAAQAALTAAALLR